MSAELTKICQLCEHPDRNLIDNDLMTGWRARDCADTYGFTLQEVLEHKMHAVYPYADDVAIEQMDGIMQETADTMRRLRVMRNELGVLKALEQTSQLVVKRVELIKRRLAAGTDSAPDIIEARDRITRALDAHPEAALAVSKALGGK